MKHPLRMILAVLVALPLMAATFTDGMPKARTGTFAITNATIHTVTNGTIERGTIVIRDGMIAAVGANVQPPADAEIIDGEGMEVYPGMIDMGTRLGLSEVGSLPETNDYQEVGNIKPYIEALTAVNPNAVAIPVTRVSGVTTVITQPSGGLIPGTAALINLHGYTPDQMYAGFRAVAVTFPTTGRRGWWDRRTDDQIQKAAEKAMEELNETWEQAKLYDRIATGYEQNPADRKPEYNPVLEALRPVVRGELPVMVEANAAADIEKAIEWITENGVQAILTGVAEGWRVADQIAAAGIPVVTGPTLSIPTRQSDRYDRAYANPALMADAGVQVALRTSESENVRNLPFNAGYAAAYGMGREDALAAVTINPARMMGVDGQIGSIEQGKHATLFVADGDVFEPNTQVAHVFIDGWLMPMTNRQIRLYDEFLNREPGADMDYEWDGMLKNIQPLGTN